MPSAEEAELHALQALVLAQSWQLQRQALADWFVPRASFNGTCLCIQTQDHHVTIELVERRLRLHATCCGKRMVGFGWRRIDQIERQLNETLPACRLQLRPYVHFRILSFRKCRQLGHQCWAHPQTAECRYAAVLQIDTVGFSRDLPKIKLKFRYPLEHQAAFDAVGTRPSAPGRTAC